MKMDTFIQLIKDLRQGQQQDDTDPNNILLQVYTSPYDVVGITDSVRIFESNYYVWGDGRTYTQYDSNGMAWSAPSCGWMWGSGGRWG